MASYTYLQLQGTGSIGENLSGLKIFTFTNPSASSYFVMETIPNYNGFLIQAQLLILEELTQLHPLWD